MKPRQIHERVGLLCGLLLLAGTTPVAGTAFARSVAVNFTGGVNATVKGVHVLKDYWFELSEDWEFTKPAVLELRFSHSPILKRDLSTVTVAMNGSPVDSFYLDKTNQTDAFATIPIPARLLRGGMNVLTLTVKMRSDLEDLCDDVHNPALWTLLDRESLLTVHFEDRQVAPDLAGFPGDYANPDLLYGEGEERVHAVILVPPDPTPAEWDALAGLTTLLGQDVGLGRGEFRVIMGGRAETSALEGRHVVLIGSPAFLRPFTAGAWSVPIPLDAVAREPAGFLMEFASPFNPARRLLVVTGRDDDAIRLVAEHLKSPASVRGLKGPVASFDKPPTDLMPEGEWSEAAFVVRLLDLKLSDMVLRGKFYHSMNFTVPNPFVGKVKDGAFLRLAMSHSELLLPQSSSLLVKVNGEPIKSIRLTRDTATRNTWDVKIPVAFLGSRYLTFELEVFMDIGDPECYYYHPEMAWFTLHNDTLLYLPVDESQGETLANYPYMFLKWNRFDRLAVTLMDPITDGAVTAAVNALAFLSQSLRSPAYVDIRMTPAKSLSEADRRETNFLLVGALGAVMGDPAWLPVLPKELVERSDIPGRTDLLNTAGFLALSPSPFDPARRILALVGRSDREIGYAAPYLYAPGKVEWVRGTLAMVGGDHELRVLLPPGPADAVARFDPTKVRFEEKDGRLVPVVEVPKPVQPPARYNVAYLVFFILTPVLVLLVILRLRALSREGRSQG